jgi:multidrug transporter EmrE-like cation transporter
MPVAILFSERPKKFYAITLCYLPLLTLVAALALMVAYNSSLWGAFSKIAEYGKYLHTEQLMKAFWQDKEIIANQVINPIAKDQAGILLASGLMGLVIHDIFTGLSIGLLALFALSLRTQTAFNRNHKLVLVSFVVINLLILLAFTFSKQFITTRYYVLAIIGIVLLMMPKITLYIESCINQRQHFQLLLIASILTLSLVDTFHKTSTKRYVLEAIQWTAENTAPELSIYTNSKHVAFYLANDYGHTNVTVNDKKLTLCTYDHAVIVERHLPQRITKRLQECNWRLDKTFEEGGRTVKIYSSVKNE